MYNNKLVVAIKSGGKVLREFKDQVFVPFGSEYIILIKNLNSVRAQVKLSIDGNDVGDGSSFVVDANKEVELTRFIKNGNLEKGNRFKFIERTPGVESHRGIGIEDGLVRVEFQFEKPSLFDQYKLWEDFNKRCCPSPTYGPIGGGYGGVLGGQWLSSTTTYSSTNISTDAAPHAASGVLRGSGEVLNQSNYNVTAQATKSINEVGVTVPGSVSDQKFETVVMRELELEKHVIVLKLLGETECGIEVVAPVTVKAKPKCITCGKLNKATAKFCSECGTSLTIV